MNSEDLRVAVRAGSMLVAGAEAIATGWICTKWNAQVNAAFGDVGH